MQPNRTGPGLPSRYRMLAQLGRGAFAEALHCEDTEAGGEVVVKLYELRERSWSPMTSFEREAEVLAQLSHPAIPRYVQHAQLPDGRLMLVQSFARGDSLAELLRRGRRFTDDEVASLTLQVLEVLEYLQGFNPPIIHRDIKPANLVVTPGGQIKLVDFGAVKSSFRSESEAASTIVGTYGYMAPEQFQGRATIQSDLYGLGATLVHMLSHIPPAELPQEGLKIDFKDRIKASSGTVAWLDRMLEPDPRQRFADAKQARAAFHARDSVSILTASPKRSPALVRNKLPPGSRIEVSEAGDVLRMIIPGSGVRGTGATLLVFGIVALAFVTFWTSVAVRGSRLFALFSLPFWVTAVWTMWQGFSAMFAVTRIEIGPEAYTFSKRLFGHVQRIEGPTAELQGASLGTSGARLNGRQLAHCELHIGRRAVKFGVHLQAFERRWVVDRINRHLGVDDSDDDDSDDEAAS